MTDNKKISRNIRILYALFAVLVIAMVVLCELNILPIEGLLLNVDPGTMYIIEVASLFGVGFGIFAALKGYNWLLEHKVHTIKGALRTKRYVAYNNARIVLLALLMLLGVFFYYGTLENWGMYYALAAFVSSLFCLPSAEGVEIELTADDNTQNS